MHSILIAVKKGNFDDEVLRTVWWNTVHGIEEEAGRNQTVTELGLACWLIAIPDGLHLFGLIVAALEKSKLSYNLVILKDAPDLVSQPPGGR